MSKQFDISLSPKAYQLYVKQLDEGVARATQIVVADQDIDQQLASEFAVLFHKMRGGAGFFGLDSLADVAGRLEELFFEGKVDSDKKQQKVGPLVHQLNELVTRLPRPSEIS